MIKKLRWKFILVNMALIFLVLLIVFLALLFFSYHQQERASYEALSRTAEHYLPGVADGNPRFEPSPPSKNWGGKGKNESPFMMPTFLVTLSKEGHDFQSLFSPNVDIEEETAKEAAEKALAQKKDRGILYDYSLRYLIFENGDTVIIAFADLTNELASMKNLVITSFLVGSGGLLAIFGICFFLSGWMVRPVDQAWRRQRQFVADASHELKTPLTVILANLNILASHKEDTIQNQWKWIGNTQSEANRMKKLVDDLLFLAKMDAAQQIYLETKVNLSDLLWSILLPFESIAYEQGIQLNSEIDPDISVMGSEPQLKQITAILLDNACKYVNRGGTVTLTLHAAGDKAALTVHNTGEPIAPEHLTHLFERFYRSDSARVHSQGGYGLGLSIAQSIMQAHHGKITVVSAPESGTAFTAVFPLTHS